jgi:transcriptional regulator with GAF, ATPase, and Fis domain
VYPKKGLFDLADKGSIFFDEIGNIPLETQAKLLRVMQEREFMRLGGMETIKVDVRIIAATNVDLRKMMEEAASARISSTGCTSINVVLPPLRDRKDDIPLLYSTSSRSTARKTASRARAGSRVSDVMMS